MSDTYERAKIRHAILRGEQPGPKHHACYCANCVEKELHPALHKMRSRLRTAKSNLAHFQKKQRAGFGSKYEIGVYTATVAELEQDIANEEARLEGRI
jgi:hypothetical protein